MEFADNTFDGVFALEATCHAKDPVIVYKEIFRVLKPGALFVETAWTMLDSYDPQNPEHVKVKNGILVRYCFFPKCTMLLHVAQGRAVAAGPVSPVSTGPLFPSLVAYLVSQIIAPLLGGRPHNVPKHIGTMLKLAKWLRTMRQNCSMSLPSNNFPFLQANDS